MIDPVSGIEHVAFPRLEGWYIRTVSGSGATLQERPLALPAEADPRFRGIRIRAHRFREQRFHGAASRASASTVSEPAFSAFAAPDHRISVSAAPVPASAAFAASAFAASGPPMTAFAATGGPASVRRWLPFRRFYPPSDGASVNTAGFRRGPVRLSVITGKPVRAVSLSAGSSAFPRPTRERSLPDRLSPFRNEGAAPSAPPKRRVRTTGPVPPRGLSPPVGSGRPATRTGLILSGSGTAPHHCPFGLRRGGRLSAPLQPDSSTRSGHPAARPFDLAIGALPGYPSRLSQGWRSGPSLRPYASVRAASR